MAYTTDSTIVDFDSRSISGWRTGKLGNRLPPEADTCDKKYTLQNPFDFSIDWRLRYVKVRVKRYSKRRKRYYHYNTWKPVSYPYYTFKEQTRTVREWRLIYQSGIKTIAESNVDPRHIEELNRRIGWLGKFLKDHGKCKALKFRQPQEQHNCTAWKTTLDGQDNSIIMAPFNSATHGKFTSDYVSWSTYWQKWITTEDTLSFSFGDGLYFNYHRRFWLPFSATTIGPSGAGISTSVCTPVRYQWTSSLLTIPMDIAFDTVNTVPTLTAMLWPDSADFEDSNAQPLVDIAEAISDGAFPLGPPPNPKEAHDRIMDNLMSPDDFAALKAGKNAIDFAANAWLWDTLVLQPVISSAIALSTSVKANDMAIDSYAKAAKSGDYIKGKSLRFLRNPHGCINGGPLDRYYEEYEAVSSTGERLGFVGTSADIEVKKAEGNAMMVYRLSDIDAAVLNSSAMRLSQFFNRLSTDLDSVLYNVLPLTFVLDWFTSEFSGVLNLKNKVYMPIADHKLVVSYKLDANVSVAKHCNYKCGVYSKHTTDSWRLWYTGKLENRTGTFETSGYTYTCTSVLEKKHSAKANEQVTYYKRQVYDAPTRRTDFSGGLGIDCFDDIKIDPLDMGKTITLGALIWGFVT